MIFTIGVIVGAFSATMLLAPALERGQRALDALRPFANAGINTKRSPTSTVFGQPLVGDGAIATVADFIRAGIIVGK